MKNLPQYDAPFSVWEKVSEALDNEAAWQQQLKQLPQHDAPDSVWQHVETRLQQPVSGARRVSMWPRWAAAAATVALLLTATYVWRADTDGEIIAYSTEQVEIPVVAGSTDFNDPVYGKVQALCRNANPKCEAPEFKNLKTELDELTLAQKELKDALGQYGNDPDLMAQLERIEAERNTLLHQLEKMI